MSASKGTKAVEKLAYWGYHDGDDRSWSITGKGKNVTLTLIDSGRFATQRVSIDDVSDASTDVLLAFVVICMSKLLRDE